MNYRTILIVVLVEYFTSLRLLNGLQRFKIGALMGDSRAFERERATIDYALDRINRNLLSDGVVYEVVYINVPNDNSLRAHRIVCQSLSRDDFVAFLNLNPLRSASMINVDELFEHFKLAYFNIYADGWFRLKTNSIYLHPDWTVLSQAYVDLLKYTKWVDYVLIYQNSDVFDRLGSVFELVKISDVYKIKLPKNIELWKPLLKSLNYNRIKKFFVDLSTENLSSFLENALEVGLLSRDKEFIFANLDLSTINMEKYIWLDVNLTAFQMVDPRTSLMKEMVRDWMLIEFKGQASPLENEKTFRTSCALIYDSLLLISKGVEKLNDHRLRLDRMDCDAENLTSNSDVSFIDLVKSIEINGSTGHLKLNKNGHRNQFELNVITLNKNGLEKVGSWSTHGRLEMSSHLGFNITEFGHLIEEEAHLKKSLTIAVVVDPPFVSLRRFANNLLQNDKYEGFCIDLLKLIARMCNFNYTIYQVEDNKYGSMNKTGKWDGLMQELILKRANIAVAALTINSVRNRFVDFTEPFLNVGLSILYKQPDFKRTNLFSFIEPLSLPVWLLILLSYIVTSLVCLINDRLSNYRREDSSTKLELGANTNKKSLNGCKNSNHLLKTFHSCVYFGNHKKLANGRANRLANISWCLFTLFLSVLYVSNYVALLTIGKTQLPFKNAQQLSLQNDIKYGCVSGGTSEEFFKESKIATYERMWAYMQLNRDVFVNSTKSGIERVKNENYAFLTESITNDYARYRDCDLIQVGDLLDSKSYGFGLSKGSPWREKISRAILLLHERGQIQEIYLKWWRVKNALGCENKPKLTSMASQVTQLSFNNIGGLFVILLSGLLISFIVNLFQHNNVKLNTSDSLHQKPKTQSTKNRNMSKKRRPCLGCLNKKRQMNKSSPSKKNTVITKQVRQESVKESLSQSRSNQDFLLNTLV